MSTIPTTLDAGAVPYTVVGAPKIEPEARASGKGRASVLSVVLLNRGSRLYRGDALGELERAAIGPVLSVEPQPEALDIEALSAKHPAARFLLLSKGASAGVQINLAMRESAGPYVLVLWNDLSLSAQGLSSRFLERLAERDTLCLAPFLYAKGSEQLPSAAAPAMDDGSRGRSLASARGRLKIIGFVPESDGEKSLYPFDYAGVYSREKFVRTGGFDANLANPYWQKLDFGFRAWLWGEEIRCSQALKLSYADAPANEDETPDEGYKWFWLKNLAPSFHGDNASIGASRFWSYLRSRGGGSAASAIGEFRSAREWAALNRYRFRTDASSLVDLWDGGERC
jgi:hypothetical protein